MLSTRAVALIIAVVVFLGLVTVATAHADPAPASTPATSVLPAPNRHGVSVGGGFHYPDMGALYFSVRPLDALSVDALVTLASLMGGIAGHIPLGETNDLFVQALGGFRHNAVQTAAAMAEAPGGYRTFVGVGFAHVSDLELRLVGGVAISPPARGNHLLFAPEIQALAGLPL